MAFWLNAGLVGIFTFLLTVGNFFWQMFKNQSKNLIWGGAFMAMVAILAHGLFDSTYWKNDLSAIFWIVLAAGYIFSQNKPPNVNCEYK
jgi:O-antigen ligase